MEINHTFKIKKESDDEIRGMDKTKWVCCCHYFHFYMYTMLLVSKEDKGSIQTNKQLY